VHPGWEQGRFQPSRCRRDNVDQRQRNVAKLGRAGGPLDRAFRA
jgi:hypothetical protein